MALKILRGILEDINKSISYAIMADVVTNVASNEQFIICFRSIDHLCLQSYVCYAWKSKLDQAFSQKRRHASQTASWTSCTMFWALYCLSNKVDCTWVFSPSIVNNWVLLQKVLEQSLEARALQPALRG